MITEQKSGTTEQFFLSTEQKILTTKKCLSGKDSLLNASDISAAIVAKSSRRKVSFKFMEIVFTDAALERLQNKLKGKSGYLKLKHDTEGCGCVVSGIAALWLVDKPEGNDTRIMTNGPDLYLDYNTEVFFDEKMTIDAQTGNHFSLKSPSEILNPAMKYYDKTKQNTGS